MDVLVVDDEPDIRQIVRRVLELEDINVVEAGTAVEALARAADTPFDVAVLDLHLPDASGLDLLAQLRSRQPRLHVIMLTGADSESDRVLGLVSGADDYVVKPFSARELAARVVAAGRRLEPPPARAEPELVRGPAHTTPAPAASAAHTIRLPLALTNADASHNATVVIVGTTLAYVNPPTLELLGATRPAEVVGRDFFDFVAPRSVGATRARHESADAGRWPRPELITLLTVDGEEVLVELASMPVIWEGEPASQVTMWELGGDTGRLRELATGIRTPVPDAVIIASTDTRIQSFNSAAEDLYGWREEEVIGRPIDEAIPRIDDADVEPVWQKLESDGRWHGEIVRCRRDGSRVRVRASTTVLRDSGGRSVGTISVHRPVERRVNGHDDVPSIEDDLLEQEIRVGLRRHQFTVHYQPVVQLGDALPVGVEALARWHHPVRGLVPPAAFIAAAERSGAIVELGQQVLTRACRQWSKWQRQGQQLHLAVNISGRQLAESGLPDRLAEVLAVAHMPGGQLWLEVTETSLVQDFAQASDVLHRIDELGAYLSIDDFGTGWASLTYLREFPVHALKIDRVFVAGLGTASRDTAIVSSMISLGRELGLAVVAEGIETEYQRDRLVELGCELGQGYFFGRPQPPERLELPVHW